MFARWRKNPPPEFQRTLTIVEAANVLNLHHATIRAWINRGAPHDRIPNPHGGRPRIMVNADELRQWLLGQRHSKTFSDSPKYGRKLLIKQTNAMEAAKQLKAVKEKLGLTNKELAEHLEIPPSVLNNYLYPELYGTKATPISIVNQAELLEHTLEPKRHPLRLPKPAEIIEALKRTGGSREPASKLLHIQRETLMNLIDQYDLHAHVKYRVEDQITRQQLQDAIVEAEGNVNQTARIISRIYGRPITEKPIDRLIKLSGLSKFLDEVRKQHTSPQYSEQEIRRTVITTQGNLNESARLLNVTSDMLDTYIDRYNLRDFAKQLRESIKGPRLTINDIQTALDQSQGNKSEAARLLGITRDRLMWWLKKYKKELTIPERVKILTEEEIKAALHEAKGNQTLAAKNLGIGLAKLRWDMQRYGMLRHNPDINLQQLFREYQQTGDPEILIRYAHQLGRTGQVADVRDEVVAMFARTIFASSWATEIEAQGGLPPQTEIMDAAPRTPFDAEDTAQEYITELEKQKNLSINAYYYLLSNLPHDPYFRREFTPREFGYLLAASALGLGVGLWELLPQELRTLTEVPSCEYAYDEFTSRLPELPMPGPHGIDTETQRKVYQLVTGELDPMTFKNVEKWVRQCYNRPRKFELILEALNELLEGHGVEALEENDEIIAHYINMGDPYVATIIYDGDYHIADWGSYLEAWEAENQPDEEYAPDEEYDPEI